MDTHEIGGIFAYIVGGIFLGLLVKYIWDKINKNYLTEDKFEECMKNHMRNCDARRLLIDTKLTDEIIIIKKIVLKLAAKADIPVNQYEDLAK